jgi:hypothetical protein
MRVTMAFSAAVSAPISHHQTHAAFTARRLLHLQGQLVPAALAVLCTRAW